MRSNLELLDCKPLHQKPDSVAIDKIRELLSAEIFKEIKEIPRSKARSEKAWLLLLKNNCYAIFKERDEEGIKNEVMAFAMAYELLGIRYAFAYTIPKTYRGVSGILQYYIPTDLELSHENLPQLYESIDIEAYQDLQVAKYLLGLRDINLDGYRAWKNSQNRFVPTYVDCEYLMGRFEEYGETHLGRSDIYNKVYLRDPLLTKWTSKFNANTMAKIKSLTQDSLQQLWTKYQFNIDDLTLKFFEERRKSVLAAYQKIQESLISNVAKKGEDAKTSVMLAPDSPLNSHQEPVISSCITPERSYAP